MSIDIPTNISGWPDVERVTGAIVRPLVENDYDVGNFVIEDYDNQIDHDRPFFELHARDAELDIDDFTKYPVIEVSCWGKSRDVAVRKFDRAELLILQSGGEAVTYADVDDDGNAVTVEAFIDNVELAGGGNEPVLENPDDRCKTGLFRFGFRPNYL